MCYYICARADFSFHGASLCSIKSTAVAMESYLNIASFLAKCSSKVAYWSQILQVVEDGYEFFAKRQLVTLFSAPNYCGEFDNAGGMMSVDETLMCSFQVRPLIFTQRHLKGVWIKSVRIFRLTEFIAIFFKNQFCRCELLVSPLNMWLLSLFFQIAGSLEQRNGSSYFRFWSHLRRRRNINTRD